MEKIDLIKTNALLEEAKAILRVETFQKSGGDEYPGDTEGGSGNKGQEKEAGSLGDPADREKLDDYTGDDATAKSDKAEIPTDVGTKVAQSLGKGMDQAKEVVKGVLGEAIKRGVREAYGKHRKGMMKEYNAMGLRDMGKVAEEVEKIASKISEGIDIKEMVYDALGEMMRSGE